MEIVRSGIALAVNKKRISIMFCPWLKIESVVARSESKLSAPTILFSTAESNVPGSDIKSGRRSIGIKTA